MARRFTIERSDAETVCEEPHPVRLGRSPEHFDGEPHEREMAIRYGKRGYLCPGGEFHRYYVWDVIDPETDEPVTECFDRYSEAKAYADRLNAEEATA